MIVTNTTMVKWTNIAMVTNTVTMETNSLTFEVV